MHEGAAESKLLEAARGAGMQTLREECLLRVRDGSTTLEEVIRVTQARHADGAAAGQDADADPDPDNEAPDASAPRPPDDSCTRQYGMTGSRSYRRGADALDTVGVATEIAG